MPPPLHLPKTGVARPVPLRLQVIHHQPLSLTSPWRLTSLPRPIKRAQEHPLPPPPPFGTQVHLLHVCITASSKHHPPPPLIIIAGPNRAAPPPTDARVRILVASYSSRSLHGEQMWLELLARVPPASTLPFLAACPRWTRPPCCRLAVHGPCAWSTEFSIEKQFIISINPSSFAVSPLSFISIEV
jgi:hypothetical protein